VSAGDVLEISPDLAPLLSIPEEQIVVCGISVGKPAVEGQRLMPRAHVDEFATFLGLDA
jgi:nitroreductase